MNASFYLGRLARMTPAEAAVRAARAFGDLWLRFGPRVRAPEPVDTPLEAKFALNLPALPPCGDLMATADKLLENRFTLFSIVDSRLGSPVDFHRDYSSGATAPAGKFGPWMDYRDAAAVGDAKYVWELNRHTFLFPLAYAYASSGDRSYAAKAEELLDEWLRQNEYPRGINWASALEAAIRLVNWSFSWGLLQDGLSRGLLARWAESAYLHCRFVRGHLSLYSSANNHLIGECLGLLSAAAALPSFRETEAWRRKALETIAREASLQIHGDGISKEQSTYYQHTVTDQLLVACCMCAASGIEAPASVAEAIGRSMAALESLRSPGGYMPKFGDEDAALSVDLGQRSTGVYQSLANTREALAGGEAASPRRPDTDFKTAAYLQLLRAAPKGSKAAEVAGPAHGAASANRLAAFIAAAGPRESFPEGGYFVIQTDRDGKMPQKLVFDCGPLGYGSLAAHGHADALSFVLTVDGFPVFVDPGTFTYHADDALRRYFRGTLAHNTVRVDGLDQSVQAGNFSWGRVARSELVAFESGARVRGRHDGYERLRDPVTHEREISFDQGSGEWRVDDRLACEGDHRYEFMLHLHPDIAASQEGRLVELRWPGHACELACPAGTEISMARGEAGGAGWYCPDYGTLRPTWSLRFSWRGSGPQSLSTAWVVSASG